MKKLKYVSFSKFHVSLFFAFICLGILTSNGLVRDNLKLNYLFSVVGALEIWVTFIYLTTYMDTPSELYHGYSRLTQIFSKIGVFVALGLFFLGMVFLIIGAFTKNILQRQLAITISHS